MMPEGPGVKRTFEFVNYADGSEIRANPSPRRVRKHVMNDFFWRQGVAVDKDRHDPRPSRGGARAPSLLRRESSNTSEPRNGKYEVPGSRRQSYLPMSPASSADSSPPPSTRAEKSGAVMLRRTSTQTMLPTPDYSSFLTPSPHRDIDASRLDPFDCLPIKGDIEVGETIKWYFVNSKLRASKSISWIHELNGSWQERMLDIAQSDKDAMHALLSIAEVKKSILTGQMDTVQYYYHIGQVLLAIKRHLAGEATNAEQPHIPLMLVSTQVSRAIGERDYETATMHMNALRRLAIKDSPWNAMCGPQNTTLAVEGILFIHAVINDVRLAAATCSKPMIPLMADRLPQRIPRRLTWEAHQRSQVTVEYFPPGFSEHQAYDIISEIHQLSLFMHEDYGKELDLRMSFSIFSRAMHRLCGLAAESRQRYQNQGTAMKHTQPVDAFVFSMLLFSRTCLPSDMPRTTRPSIENSIEVALLGHIHNVISPAPDLLAYWSNAEASMECLLWVLFLATTICIRFDLVDVTWFSDRLKRVVKRLAIQDMKKFESTLKLFPWIDFYFEDHFEFIGETLGLTGGDSKEPDVT